MPGLAKQDGNVLRVPGSLRIVCDGTELLAEPVHAFERGHNEIYFGENPVGGTSCSAHFGGTLTDLKGRALRGFPRQYFSRLDRLTGWLTDGRWAVATALLLALAGAKAVDAALEHGGAPRTWVRRIATAASRHRWCLLAMGICGLAFAWLVTAGSFEFIHRESFGDFYDFQALSLLQGRLDVPPEVLSGEGFYYGGKCYGYFGLCPAVIRLPFVALGIAFGQTSRALMTVYFLGALLAANLILNHLRLKLAGKAAYPSFSATLLLTFNVGLGSTFIFLASRAYIYHEAILAGAAFALWSAYFTFRYLADRRLSSGLGALAFGFGAVHCRPTSGLFALSFLGIAALIAAWQHPRPLLPGAKRHFAIAGLSAAAFLSFCGVSYLKFRTFAGMPLRYNVQFLDDPGRLGRIEGKELHLENVRANADAYFLSFTGKLTRRFPYLRNQSLDTARYPGIKYDMNEPILAIPFCMPGLTFLALMGLIVGPALAAPFRPALGALALAAVPMTAVLLMAVVSSQRYTADFIPIQIVAAAAALAAIERKPWGPPLRIVATILLVASIFACGALALRFQGEEVWGVPDSIRTHYRELSRWFDRSFGGLR